MRILDVETVRAVERREFRRRPTFEVMTDAAAAVARACSDLPDPLLFVAGKGNNGGDACVAAGMLALANREVHLWRPLGPPVRGGDAERAAKDYARMGGPEAGPGALKRCGAVVDGLFGIGLDRNLADDAARCVRRINSSGKPVLAIDVPSGLDSDRGAVMGAAVRADRTVTFFGMKPGLLMRAGRDHAGEVIVADLSTGDDGTPGGELVDGPVGTGRLRRKSDSNKGDHGSLAVIGGSAGMLGALMLATRAAVAHGAGKVFAVETGGSGTAVDPLRPEVMWREEVPDRVSAAAVGVGAGVTDSARDWLREAVGLRVPLVVDADGLNMLAASPRMRTGLKKRRAPTVLTPHPAEAARLLGKGTAEVQDDRVGSALRLAKRLASVVALKGSGTVVAGPDGRWGIVSSGNPGLAQAGSGDVLTGIVGALLCQGVPAWEAAAAGSWLLGAGADRVRSWTGGEIGLLLDEITAESSSILAGRLSG